MVGKADPPNDRENLALECAFTEGVRRNCIMTTVNWKSIFLATVVTTSIGVSIEDGSTSGLAEGQTAPVGRPVGGNWKRQLLALDKISTSPVNKDPNAVSGRCKRAAFGDGVAHPRNNYTSANGIYVDLQI